MRCSLTRNGVFERRQLERAIERKPDDAYEISAEVLEA